MEPQNIVLPERTIPLIIPRCPWRYALAIHFWPKCGRRS